ncbi:V-type proton ATPase subunit S1-like protein [Ambystoma mexicanum]|uniref:V-type proton ATPase subunit S1-like protein n=1 Tax=Ambystoma mexicanum TaxID=8296 RepID=UPI0037E9A476
MEINTPFCLLILVLSAAVFLSDEQMLKSPETSSQAKWEKQWPGAHGQPKSVGVKPKPWQTQVAVIQRRDYNKTRKEKPEGAAKKSPAQKHNTPVNFTVDGRPCILFQARRIMIKFKNQSQLDLTDKTFGMDATVDVADSNCSKDLAMLSLKFGDIESLKGLIIRFILTNSYHQLSVQNWFTLHSLQILYNNSIKATFNASRIFAPESYSYHCQRVSSLPRYDALLVPRSGSDVSRLWEVTFIDFQIQGFNVEDGQFSYAKDCETYFSPAVLMGLVMSLVLLLVLAYTLHMLIHLKAIDRHYECKVSIPYFPAAKDSDFEEEKEPLRCSTSECYELQPQQYCRFYMQQCSSISH